MSKERKQRFWLFAKRFGKVIGLIGAICSILAFITATIWSLPVKWLGSAYLCFPISMCIIFLWESRNRAKAELDTRNHRERIRVLAEQIEELGKTRERLTQSFENLHEVYHSLRDCYCLLNDENGQFTRERNDQFLMGIVQTLDRIVRLFQDFHGVRFSASIKLITDEKTLEVCTLRRDSKSSRERTDLDQIPSRIGHHCAFKKIVSDGERHFFSSDFVADQKKGKFFGRGNWQKHYRSGAALPIKRHVEVTKGKEQAVIPEYLGFLCVDTKKSRILSEDFMVSILAGIADMLYVVCKRYRSLTEANGRSKKKK